MKKVNELAWIFSFLFGSGIVTVINLKFILQYNLHIIIMGAFISLAVYLITNRRVKQVEESIKEMIINQEKQRLKATVSAVFNEYKNIKVIDFSSNIKYIYELEETRVKLGVNSFTEEKLKSLIEKIDLSKVK